MLPAMIDNEAQNMVWKTMDCRLMALLVAGISWTCFLSRATSEERTWSDATEKFTITAELLASEDGKVVFRQSDGKQITVPFNRLSKADQIFIQKQGKEAAMLDTDSAGITIAAIATAFFEDLHNRQRDVAKECLTKIARELMEGGKSPLAGLPQPDKGKNAIRVTKAKITGKLAEIPVIVRAGGNVHRTKLHLRFEENRWVVFALSAKYPNGDQSINFEAEGTTRQKADPLEKLVGKPLELAGVTLNGNRLDMTQYDGKVVLVDFWATWCGPCRAEMPNIYENWKKHHAQGFDVIAISVDKDMNALQSFVAKEEPPWAVVADKHPANRESMGAKYGIRGIPAFILLGRDGKVAAVNCRGKRLGQQLTKMLAGNAG